jgi:hypothetical protein
MDQTKEQLLDEWLHSDLEDAKPLDENCFDYGFVQTVIFRRDGTDIKVKNWARWIGREAWKPEEATCLFFEINPIKLPKDKIEQLHERLGELYRLAEEKGPMSPYRWVLFAKERKIYIPKPLQDIEPSDREINDHSVTTEPQAEAINTGNNDIAYTGLLNDLRRKDDWFQVIDDMTKAFYKQHGTIPNEVQAWGRLWTKHLAGYEITTGTDKGEDCLKMPGVSPLSRLAFAKRWRKYSANSGQ